MRFRSVMTAFVVLPSLLAAQEQDTAKGMIRVPAGTHVQLELINKLSSRASHVGDRVRAQTAFPVAVAGSVVIPAGTFVEGKLEKISPHSSQAKFFMNFDRITFANGYTVTGGPGEASARLNEPMERNVPVGAFGFQSAPTLPGPPAGFAVAKYAVIGASVATAVFFIIAVSRGKSRQEYTLEPGTKMEMVLESDLLVDSAQAGAVRP